MSALAVEVLERVESRWRVRVVLSAPPARGYTVGFVGEDGAPLGPAVVAPEGAGETEIVEVRGPCSFPPGAVVRVVLHTEGGPVQTHDVVVARRRGLHFWLSAGGRLPLVSRAEPEALGAAARARLAARWCWFGAPEDSRPCPTLDPALKEMLEECGVDPDSVTGEVLEALRGR